MDNSPINRFLQMATSCPLLCKTPQEGKCCALEEKFLTISRLVGEIGQLVGEIGQIVSSRIGGLIGRAIS